MKASDRDKLVLKAKTTPELLSPQEVAAVAYEYAIIKRTEQLKIDSLEKQIKEVRNSQFWNNWGTNLAKGFGVGFGIAFIVAGSLAIWYFSKPEPAPVFDPIEVRKAKLERDIKRFEAQKEIGVKEWSAEVRVQCNTPRFLNTERRLRSTLQSMNKLCKPDLEEKQ